PDRHDLVRGLVPNFVWFSSRCLNALKKSLQTLPFLDVEFDQLYFAYVVITASNLCCCAAIAYDPTNPKPESQMYLHGSYLSGCRDSIVQVDIRGYSQRHLKLEWLNH